MHPAVQILIILVIIAVLARKAKSLAPQAGVPTAAVTVALGVAVKAS